MQRLSSHQLLQELRGVKDLLIVQDLDGVCMQLVQDPLNRRIDASYVTAAAQFGDSFAVLTNGEHEGRRGVNRVVEQALGNDLHPARNGLYLPGLAAGGVQLQNRYGQVSNPGVSEAEIAFLTAAPHRMEELLRRGLSYLLPEFSPDQLTQLAHTAVLDTQMSPTVNLNGVFAQIPDDVVRQQALQGLLQQLMGELLTEAVQQGLAGSFFLHVAPNLGCDADGLERLKPAVAGDVGTTDIQFMLSGSLKEAGLLVLLNQYMACHYGEVPFGEEFNVRIAPNNQTDLLKLVQDRIPAERMPLLVGVGDTVTSNRADDDSGWLRGGSDRGFLTLLQTLGTWSGRANRVVLVDSSHGEVDRPSLSHPFLAGITDANDPLQLNVLMLGGPDQYITWFQQLAKVHSSTIANKSQSGLN
ncbi:glucosylglycerol 3-phosphatase [Synechococcus sp. M16CYN]|uniref:glucosylglycerol 3-phosphatase n=1 Tax=Synechococcus sp. M16CYN TaxID=3103139 RepID=UPI00334175C8